MSQDEDKQDAVNQVVRDTLITGIGISRVGFDSFTLRIPSVDEVRAQAEKARRQARDEARELAARLIKLDQFIASGEHTRLPGSMSALLLEQRGHMKQYLCTLTARIALMEVEE